MTVEETTTLRFMPFDPPNHAAIAPSAWAMNLRTVPAETAGVAAWCAGRFRAEDR
jgi:hypothetical protein